jgi:hypothetical protein
MIRHDATTKMAESQARPGLVLFRPGLTFWVHLPLKNIHTPACCGERHYNSAVDA